MSKDLEKFLNAPDWIALICLIAGAIAIGASPILVRVSEVGPFATGFWRVFFALPILAMVQFIYFRCKPIQVPISYEIQKRDYLSVILAGALIGGI